MDILYHMETENQSQTAPPAPQEVNVFDIEIKDESTALNVLVTFINVAQKRGAYNVQESAKIWECIKMFQKNAPPQQP
jgi:hypothetical protein